MLPTFPSRYWSTIGLPGVFSLAGWSPQFRTGFHVPRPTQVTSPSLTPCPYGGLTLYAGSFHFLPVRCRRCIEMPLQPSSRRNDMSLGSAPFARHYSGYRFFLSLPAGTKMFQFPAFAPDFSQVTDLQSAGLPHSDMCGSTPVCRSPHLFAAYHVLPRLRIA